MTYSGLPITHSSPHGSVGLLRRRVTATKTPILFGGNTLDNLNIFIVDDDEDFAESLADIFELEGHKCELAHDGETAFKRFNESDFDLTFMDVKLPGYQKGKTRCQGSYDDRLQRRRTP